MDEATVGTEVVIENNTALTARFAVGVRMRLAQELAVFGTLVISWELHRSTGCGIEAHHRVVICGSAGVWAYVKRQCQGVPCDEGEVEKEEWCSGD